MPNIVSVHYMLRFIRVCKDTKIYSGASFRTLYVEVYLCWYPVIKKEFMRFRTLYVEVYLKYMFYDYAKRGIVSVHYMLRFI